MSLSWNEGVWTCVAGVVAIGIGASVAFGKRRLEKTAPRASGRVIEMVASYASGSGPSYAPRFEFETPNGKTWTVLSLIGTQPAAFSVGDRVEVLYSARNPANARIDSFSQLFLLPMIVCLIGVAIVVFGAGALLKLW